MSRYSKNDQEARLKASQSFLWRWMRWSWWLCNIIFLVPVLFFGVCVVIRCVTPKPPPLPILTSHNIAQSPITQSIQSRLPIVLIHGFLGFDRIFGQDYFEDIAPTLQRDGATVFTASVSAVNSNAVRGDQLIAQLVAWQATLPTPQKTPQKFHLIGHSQGGLTARYVAAMRPDLVASVTTIATPHTGSAVADVLREWLPPDSWRESLAIMLVHGAVHAINFASQHDHPHNAHAALHDLTTAGAQQFNQRFPQAQPISVCGQGVAVVNGIHYLSLGATRVMTHWRDPLDYPLWLTHWAFGNTLNDGLVAQCATHWGQVWRDDYPWNHLDAVNQWWQLRADDAPDPRQVYRDIVQYLDRHQP